MVGGFKGKQRTNLEALASGQAGRRGGRAVRCPLQFLYKSVDFFFRSCYVFFSLPNLPDMARHIESLSPEHVDGPFLCV